MSDPTSLKKSIAAESQSFDIASMHARATQASQLLKALANPDRLILLCHLSQHEMCVSELETATGVKQPTLSQQLTVLRNENLVETRREGKQIYYRVKSEVVLQLLQVLYQQFCQG